MYFKPGLRIRIRILSDLKIPLNSNLLFICIHQTSNISMFYFIYKKKNNNFLPGLVADLGTLFVSGNGFQYKVRSGSGFKDKVGFGSGLNIRFKI